MDLAQDSDPDPTPDPDVKKYLISYFFLITYPQVADPTPLFNDVKDAKFVFSLIFFSYKSSV
jgi:hypothetical protein